MSKFSLDNLDKSTWEPHKFQEIAERISLTVDPTTTELEIYVGLEHIDAEDIHIRRFGKPSDVKGNKLKCFKGDVIFGKRRAYQRKAAIVDFDGICSAHSFVFRAKPNIIEPKLLPFFLHSDQFMHRAVDISVGGLSPTINWGDLKDEEFLLPPKEEQKKLAELLWAMDDVVEKEKRLLEKLDANIKSTLNTIYQPNSEQLPLKEVCVILDNLRKPLNYKERNDESGTIPYYGANGLAGYVDKFIFNEKIILVAEDGGNFKEYLERPIAYVVEGKSWVNNHAHVIKFKDDSLNQDWLFYQLVHRNILKHITGTTRLKLTKGELENIKIWMPSKSTIREYCTKIKTFFGAKGNIALKIQSSKSLQKSLINQIF